MHADTPNHPRSPRTVDRNGVKMVGVPAVEVEVVVHVLEEEEEEEAAVIEVQAPPVEMLGPSKPRGRRMSVQIDDKGAEEEGEAALLAMLGMSNPTSPTEPVPAELSDDAQLMELLKRTTSPVPEMQDGEAEGTGSNSNTYSRKEGVALLDKTCPTRARSTRMTCPLRLSVWSLAEKRWS